MSQYSVVIGDTFDLIARKVYGDEQDASLIARANPGVIEPLTADVIITIPERPDAPSITEFTNFADDENEVVLNVAGKRFRFWENIKITRTVDSFDTITFSAPFDVDNKEFKAAFQPFNYTAIDVTISGEPLFTGIMVSVNPTLEASRRAVDVMGYSKPGVLNDCTPPASAFPLEWNGQGLQDIARDIAATFGLAVEFTGQQGAIFERVAADPDKKAYQFLMELARQRNFIISSTARGAVLFQRSVNPGDPVATLEQGVPPLEAVTPEFNPQQYYSHVTGVQPALLGIPGAQFTVENPRLKGVIRPLTFKADDTDGTELKEAVEAKAGRMFGSAVSYPVTVSTWRDSQGDLWAPNTTIVLVAPGAMVYTEYEFIIRSVTLSRSGGSESAVLNLVLPGAFEGKIPEVLPWDV